ncbi:MAG: peptide chain release factor N(5)-glutamine methyltransferase [Clostridiales bacterium]|nr:peptide chain release factor N(5)-glutamine methyltransferase [Clostridiales bacterium]
MILKDLYSFCLKTLKNGNIEDAEFEAGIIFEESTGLRKTDLILKGENAVDDKQIKTAENMLQRRLKREPLQYIIGHWEFMGLDFEVGEGVLIPRPETEALVEFAIEFIKEKPDAVVFDLCSGSGCIGLSVAEFCPQASVYMLEKSDNAFKYLKKNLKKSSSKSIKAIKADITKGFDYFSQLPKPDLILSNPPYIISDEIPSLQAEVQFEPVMALDGGSDGFDFYKCLCDEWFAKITDLTMAVECGENQAFEIEQMIKQYTSNTQIIKDFNNIERIVTAKK